MADTTEKTCLKCSTINSPENKFCKECGAPLPDQLETNKEGSEIRENPETKMEELTAEKSVSTEPETSEDSNIKIARDKGTSKPHKKEDPVEGLMDTGKEIMEGIGGFIDKATGAQDREANTGDGRSINGMITEERVGFSGQHSTDMQQATFTLEDDKLIITKRSFLGESDRGEKHIRYEDITTVDLDKKALFTPGALQIYTTSGQITVRKNKAHKLEPFFKELSKKVDEAKSTARSPMVSEKSAADELRKFAQLMDDGIITEEEFQAKKKEIMNL